MTAITPKKALLTMLLVAGVCGWPMAAVVQAQRAPANPPGANAPAPMQNAPSQFDSQSKEAQRKGENLSERLDRTDGVIKPPAHADSGIYVTPPATGDAIMVPPPEKQVTPK